jgi:hypothetical protein
MRSRVWGVKMGTLRNLAGQESEETKPSKVVQGPSIPPTHGEAVCIKCKNLVKLRESGELFLFREHCAARPIPRTVDPVNGRVTSEPYERCRSANVDGLCNLFELAPPKPRQDILSSVRGWFLSVAKQAIQRLEEKA